ncbi:PAS domain-containing protein [Pedobacter sp. SYSU D00535]|uniref:PAS domain-containing protein n=1 Tax=Pedobacter sp. SYSU D00535 TaxID=2810308 RepID=UPI001A960008|nr:PAS domain-containing protein [Pedobacter sp. SYSU D00535]
MNTPMHSLNTDQLLRIFSLSKHPVAIYTTEHLLIETANEAMCQLWSKDSKVVVGQPLEKAVPELTGQPFLTLLKEVWVSGSSFEAKDVPIKIAVNGVWEWCYFDIDYQAIQDEEGKVYAILQTAVDVAKRGLDKNTPEVKNAKSKVAFGANRSFSFLGTGGKESWSNKLVATEEQRENESDRLKRFFMQAPAGICILDGPDFVFEMVNPQYQQLFPGRKLLGMAVMDALPELKGEAIEEILLKVYQTGEVFEGRELLVPLSYTADGPLAERYFNFIYQPRKNGLGAIDGILVFVIEVTETVRNRKKIEENEANLRSLVMSSHYGLMILRGREYEIEIVNHQIANLWRKSLAEITGKKLLEVLPEIEDQPFPALLNKVYTTGISYGQEEEVLYLQTPDGLETKYISFFYDPLRDGDGNVNGVIVACEDITEKVEARLRLQESFEEQQSLNEELTSTNEELAALNEEMEATNEELIASNEELLEAQNDLQKMIRVVEDSENKVRAMVASAPFPIGVYEGREMRIVLANQSIMDVWGKGDDVLGKRYSEVLPELANQEIFDQLDQVFTTGTSFHARNQRLELIVDGKPGTFYFNYSFTPLYDRAGAIYGVMNTASDVTDLYLAKQKIEQNERYLHNMILQAPVAMCILSGPEHIISVANPPMIELWGKPKDSVMYKPVFEALPDAREQGLEQIMAEVYHKGESFRADEMPVTLIRNGIQEIVYQNFVYEPHRDSEGNIIGVIAITIDVTEQVLARKKIEQNETELLEVKKQLEAELEANKEIQHQKDSFIGIASHELKTPLTSLTAIIQVANRKLRDMDDPFLAGAMEKAQLQVKRMLSMISGFLNISRLESGNMIIDKQRFDLEGLMKEVIDEIGITSNSHTINFSSCGPLAMEADRDKMNSVISNLLSNAIKYSPQGKEVFVSTEFKNENVLIRVKDQGIGIRTDDQQKVFNRYYRVETDHTQHISGFGIGLYLSSEIVRRHGGDIWVESELGKGSTFCILLPVDKNDIAN